MAQQVITLGASPFENFIWDGSVLLRSSFLENATTVAYLRRVRSIGAGVQVHLSSGPADDPEIAGPNFSDVFIVHDQAFTFSVEGLNDIVLRGPNSPNHPVPSPEDPYFWSADNGDAFHDWVRDADNLNNIVTLTLDDGIPNVDLSGTATVSPPTTAGDISIVTIFVPLEGSAAVAAPTTEGNLETLAKFIRAKWHCFCRSPHSRG